MHTPQDIRIADYTYTLPDERIAKYPSKKRDESKLLIYKNGTIEDNIFSSLPEQLPEGCLLVFNNSRVINARIYFQKASGTWIEVFCLEPSEKNYSETPKTTVWKCMVGNSRKWKDGEPLIKALKRTGLRANLLERGYGYFMVQFAWDSDESFYDILAQAGELPLPPYLKRDTEEADVSSYQTVYAKPQGSVAAPTAGLHFTPEVFDQLKSKSIKTVELTLHVGAGTFKPVKAETMEGHTMHGEWMQVSPEQIVQLFTANEMVAVGTTSLRMLETLYWVGVKLIKDIPFLGRKILTQWEAYELPNDVPLNESLTAAYEFAKENGSISGITEILIAPGYPIKTARKLITNFHQPDSTLLLLVAAFIGNDWRKIYEHALANDYRFLSYGDSSLLMAE
ncbi:MAG: S-adenosylmethionine:tRNA ribosyltransferase-isomerase [Flavobacteriaceae bacterium]|nr:S-adenosylmethionine:tRNA ribosyltransferase-isomerase [Flavobacteriaceae bacterium]